MSVAVGKTDVAKRRPVRDVLARLGRDTPVVQVLVLLAVFLYGALSLDGFSAWGSIKSMLLLASFLGLAAVGQTVLVLLGYIDLSVPGFIGLGNVLTAILVGQDHWSFVASTVVILVVSAGLGTVSGYICHRFAVQSIVVTLGMNFSVLGVLGVLSGSGITGTAPTWLTRFATVGTKTLGVDIPPLVVLWAVVAVLLTVVLGYTIRGRRLYLTGSNPRAADLALVKTRRVVAGAFALSALGAAVTGILLTGFSGSGDISVGSPYLFTSLTAVIVGGTSIVGARGDYVRTVIGALMLTVVTTVLLAKGFSEGNQQILFGLIILAAALAYGRDARLRDRV